MKEQTTYVAIDADNVGDSVGNAVLNDDTSSLSSISQNINAGTQIFSQWAEFNGGTIISNGSDEAVFQVPITSIGELEELKRKYQEQTGFTISIGIGETVSSAAKALIYAKMNGKDQITDYSPEMEDAMKQAISGNLQEDVQSETMPHQEESSEEIPEHEQEMAPEEKAIHDETEVMSDDEEIQQEEMAAVGEEAMGEDEAMGEMIDSRNPEDEDIDLDGRPDMEEEHGEIALEDDLNQDGDIEHEEAMAAESEEYMEEDEFAEEEYVDEESDELSESIEGEMEGEEEYMEEGMEEEYMEEGDEEMSQEMPMEDYEGDEELPEEMSQEIPEEEYMEEGDEEMVEGDGSEELKNIIFESLQNFKANREYLEDMSQHNPELYNSLIYVLQAMIEMARELGYGNMDEEMGELSEEETMDEAVEIEEEMESEEEGGFPEEDSDEEDFEEDSEEENEEGDEEDSESEEEEYDFGKNERFISLLSKMGTSFREAGLTKGDELSQIEQLKEKLKDKTSQKGKTGKKSSKRKKSAKKAAKPDKKKKNKSKKPSNDGSFCAKSHDKMKASGKDCRANEDSDSPVCLARKKLNCRGKNEEKGNKIGKSEGANGNVEESEIETNDIDGNIKDNSKIKSRDMNSGTRTKGGSTKNREAFKGKERRKKMRVRKSEKLASFLKKKDEIHTLEKNGLATKDTTKKVHQERRPAFSTKGTTMKIVDAEGNISHVDMSHGAAKGVDGLPERAEGQSPRDTKKQKTPKAAKV